MADYKTIHGTKVRTYTTNPDNPIEGQVWYNDTDNVLKFQFPNRTSSWRTANVLNTARRHLAGAGASNTISLAFGGNKNPNTVTGETESYDGTNWTEVADLNTARQNSFGSGTYTSALASGGYISTNSAVNESWNGTNWTEVNDLNTARGYGAAAGTDNTNGLIFGGNPSVAITESWNGSSWTEVGDLNTGRQYTMGSGKSNTAALAFGGETPPHTAKTENWNGTNWTEVADMNTARFLGGGAGTNTDAIVFGGRIDDPSTTYGNTELWNGTSWAEQNDLVTGRSELSGSGSSTSGLAFGGTPGGVALTEEWTGAGEPIGAWSTGGTMNNSSKTNSKKRCF